MDEFNDVAGVLVQLSHRRLWDHVTEFLPVERKEVSTSYHVAAEQETAARDRQSCVCPLLERGWRHLDHLT